MCARGDEWTDEYRFNVMYASLMVAVFPFGVPLVLFFLLRLKREAIEERDSRRGGPELENFSFLFCLYSRDHVSAHPLFRSHSIQRRALSLTYTLTTDVLPLHLSPQWQYSIWDLVRRLLLSSCLLALPTFDLTFMTAFCVSVVAVIVFREVGPYW